MGGDFYALWLLYFKSRPNNFPFMQDRFILFLIFLVLCLAVNDINHVLSRLLSTQQTTPTTSNGYQQIILHSTHTHTNTQTGLMDIFS